MIDEGQVRNIVKKVLDEEHLTNFIKIFEKEHNLFRGSHDKIGLPEALEIHQTIINHIVKNFEDEAITTEKIADGAIVNKKLYDECVSANKIADEAIEEAKIAADAVTALKINVVGLDGGTGRICVVDDVDADEITAGINAHALTLIEAGKILISGETDLSDWRHGVDATLIDGGKIYTQSITAAQILAGCISADKINVGDFIYLPSDENLVGYWSLDEGSGVLAVDGSGHGNDGTLVSMTAEDWVDGKVGKCLDFDGVDDYVDCGNDLSLDFATQNKFTISFWANADVLETAYLIDKQQADYKGYFIYLNSAGKINVGFPDGSDWNELQSTGGITIDTWYFITVVHTGTQQRIYINGVLDIERDEVIALVDSTLDLLLGKYSGGIPFDGLIDEVRIYSYALTASEIKALYLYPAGNKYRVISGVQIADDTITAAKIVAGTITAEEILARTITADRIALGAITADEIAAGAITADEIFAGTITADEIKIGGISVDRLQACLSENFDGLSIGNISGQGDYGSVAGTWVNNSGAGCTAEVTTRSGADRMLRLNDQGTGLAGAYLNYNAGYEVVSGVFEFQGRNSVTNKTARFILYQNSTYFIRVEFADTGQIIVRGPDGVSHNPQAFSANTWYKIRVLFDAGAGYLLVWINGVFKAKYIVDFSNAFYANKIQASTMTVASGYNFDVDNLKILNLVTL